METDFDSLREDMANGPLAPIMGLIAAIETGQQTDKVLGTWLKEVSAEIAKLWEDAAERRDELHALANRVETLTRTALNPSSSYCGRRDCRFTEPHYHDPDDGHVIINHAAWVVDERQT